MSAQTSYIESAPGAHGPPVPQDHRRARNPAAETLAPWTRLRRATLALVAHLDDATLQRTHSPIMSPLVWDLAHIAAYEDLWLAHRHAGLQLLRPELAELYDAFETPRAVRGEIELLDAARRAPTCEDVRARVARGDRASRRRRRRARASWCCATSCSTPRRCARRWRSPGCCRRASRAARAAAACGPATRGAGSRCRPELCDGSRPSQAPRASPTTTSARATPSRTGAFASRAIRSPTRAGCASARAAATSGASGGRDEGWAWKEEHDITPPSRRGSGDRGRRSATSAGSRPTPSPARTTRGCRREAEWERAATAASRATRAGGVGQVWEWTGSRFGGYPGFVAYPYREYSEVFFGEDYLVLRGGSWATQPARGERRPSATGICPQRRQIFAGRAARAGRARDASH